MRRLAMLIVVGCVLLGGCDRRCVGPECTALDYLDFLRFGGITYYAGDSNLVGRKPRPSDLGPVFAVVRRNPPNDDLNYQMRDGDAAYVAPGAPVYTVKGYRPAFRLAAGRHPLRFYEAREVPGARSGADVLDLAGKVRYIGINSGFDGTTELAAIKQRKRVATLVAAVLEAPFGSGQVSEGASCVVAFHLGDRTAVTRGFHLGTGRLEPGVLVPRTFSGPSRLRCDRRTGTAASSRSRIERLVLGEFAPVVGLPEVGIDTAGQLLVTAGDNPQRLRGAPNRPNRVWPRCGPVRAMVRLLGGYPPPMAFHRWASDGSAGLSRHVRASILRQTAAKAPRISRRMMIQITGGFLSS